MRHIGCIINPPYLLPREFYSMVERDYDVIVAGGGIAGVSAAVSASRTGAKVLLIERYGFLGGMATAGLVNPFMTWKTSTGVKLIAGIFKEIIERLDKIGALKTSSFDSEGMKFVCLDMAIDSNVDMLLHTMAIGAIKDGNDVRGIKAVSKSGEININAKVVIDATGDGDIAADAGANFEIGSDEGGTQAMTLMLDVGGVDVAKALAYVRDNPEQMRFPKLPKDANLEEIADGVVSVAGYYEIVAQAKSKGDYPLPGDLVFYIGRPRRGEVVFNTTHVGGVDGTKPEDLTKAEIEGRKQAAALVKFAQKYLPGFENAYLLRTATQIGVRETRRIIGEYVFCAEDVIKGAKFDDAIARLAYSIDVHSGRGEGYTKSEERAKPAAPPDGDWYEVPYRCLVPLRIDNLLVAGRCVSSTQEGHGAIRIMPCCAAMGQAAGTAAAIAIQDKVTPRKVNIPKLLETLRSQGALV